MKQRGFNFVEYCAVLVIIVLLVTIAYPRIVALQSSEEAVDFRLSLSNIALSAREYAILNQAAVTMSFDSEGNLAWAPVQTETTDSGASISLEEAEQRQEDRRVETPEDVQYTVYQRYGRDVTQQDWVCEFNADGSSDRVTLEFEQSGRPFFFRIESDRGLPVMSSGRLSEQPPADWDAGEIELRG